MRLLHAKEFRFEEFYDYNTPPYIILSHRWGKYEVSYQDFLQGRRKEGPGYDKIIEFCRHGRKLAKELQRDIEWVWIDTCNIDKSSSAELSEAINSMFTWYRKAEFCCVYLSDVADAAIERSNGYQSFQKSEWFTRGWTLQELLAPEIVEFFDCQWRPIGSKLDLIEEISTITGIAGEYLEDAEFITEANVATRMSWASKRKTSRVEDIAYCLLGLFDVNMPLLYGEGHKAFQRLQEEIIRRSNDETIFAWRSTEPRMYGSFLAESVRDFAECKNIEDGIPANFPRWKRDKPYTMTNFGLQMDIKYLEIPENPDYRLVALFCHESNSRNPFFIALWNPLTADEDRRTDDREYEAWVRAARRENEIIKDLSKLVLPSLQRGEITLKSQTVFIQPRTQWER